MHILSALLFSFSANLDTFIVGMSYGIKKSHISLPGNLIVSLITLTGTIISITAGLSILPYLPPSIAGILGSAILIMLGLYYIVKFLLIWLKERHASRKLKASSLSSGELAATGMPDDTPDTSLPAIPPQKLLSFKECALMGFALSINNIGMGIGASITGVALLPAAVFTLFFSMMFLSLGNHVGESSFFQAASRFADPLSGLILIGLGVYELFV